MNVIKKINKDTALKGAFICWFMLGFCLYYESIINAPIDIITIVSDLFKDFDPLYMFKGGRPLDPVDFANYINNKKWLLN